MISTTSIMVTQFYKRYTIMALQINKVSQKNIFFVRMHQFLLILDSIGILCLVYSDFYSIKNDIYILFQLVKMYFVIIIFLITLI